MKTVIAAGAVAVALALVQPARAQPAPREYNRGYYDCLAGRFDEEAQSHAYHQGCRAARREREREDEGAGGCPPDAPGCEGTEEPPRYPPPGGPGYGPPPGYRSPGYGGGAVAPVGPPNVRGMGAAQVLAAMAGRGFHNVGTSVVGAAVFGIYFNPATRECVQVANANGRAVDAREIGSDPRCR